MAAAKAGKLVVVSPTSYVARRGPLADNCVFQGGRRFHIRHISGGLVDLLRHHACQSRFPIQPSRRRPIAHCQRSERKAESQRCRIDALKSWGGFDIFYRKLQSLKRRGGYGSSGEANMNSNLLDLTFLDIVSIFAHEHLYIPCYHHPPTYRKPSLSARTPSYIPSSLPTTLHHR